MKLHPKSANDRDTSDCNDTGSLEPCIWKNRANLPVFAEFLLSFTPLSKHDTSYSTNTSLNFSQPFWLVIQWLKTDNITFFDFLNLSWDQKNLTCLPVTSVNLKIDHRKNFKLFYIDHRRGQDSRAYEGKQLRIYNETSFFAFFIFVK